MNFLEKPRGHGTVHYSIRTNREISSAIEKEAEDRGISINNLINQILVRYVKRDRYFDHLGFIPMSKDVLRKWLSRIDEKSLIEDAKELGSKVGREYISYTYHDVNQHTLLKFLDLWFSRFESYQHKADGDAQMFAVNHGISIQYSTYLKEFLRALIEPVISRQVKFLESTENVISFYFEI